MSLLKLIETNTTPPDGYRYVDQNDGYKIGPYNSKEGWFDAILKHKRDNGYPIPPDWKEEAEDFLARILPVGWALYRETGEPAPEFVNARMGGEDVLNGTRVLLDLVRKAAAFKLFGLETPFVTQEEAAERTLICSRCPMNAPIEGCFSCYGLVNLIEEVAVGIETESDHLCKSCLVCKCSNKAQSRVKAEVLKQGVTEEQMKIFRTLDWCWKWKCIDALNNAGNSSTPQ